jgi:plastocyanin/mono/diheme cytochrome c family protein
MMTGRRGESVAIISALFMVVGLPALVLGYQFLLRPALADVRTIDIVAAAPEVGGFQPDSIRVAAGEKVRLRFSVPDVTNGIAIGPGLEVDLGHVDPGEVSELEMTFAEPGRYTYYCNTWCSPNHWRMRGTIEVYDSEDPDALIVADAGDPVLDALTSEGVDIDAPHDAVAIPTHRPSAGRGKEAAARLGAGLPSELVNPESRRSISPAEAWTLLTDSGLKEDDAWDVVAHLWLGENGAGAVQIAETAALYAKNCAACHGEDGNGEGPGADALALQGMGHGDAMTGHSAPTAFSDPRTLLGGSSGIYYAKIRRGGMGTGMPGFGPLLTYEETWGLVDLLWTFVFDE